MDGTIYSSLILSFLFILRKSSSVKNRKARRLISNQSYVYFLTVSRPVDYPKQNWQLFERGSCFSQFLFKRIMH